MHAAWEVLTAEFGPGREERTADQATGIKMTSLELVLWPVAN